MLTREAIAADIPTMIRLLGYLFAQEAEFVPGKAAQRRGLEMILADPDASTLLVAEEAGQVIGMVSLLYTVSTALGARVALLEDMVVAPEVRNTGVGRELLEAAIARARADGCRRITLLTDGANTEAQRFYERAGFSASEMLPMRLMLD